MIIVTLFLATLATWQAIEIWHHGSLFADWRQTASCWSGMEGLHGFVGRLLSCPFCLSPWAAVVVSALLLHGGPYGEIAVGALAVSRLANLCNDAVKQARRFSERALALMPVDPTAVPPAGDPDA